MQKVTFLWNFIAHEKYLSLRNACVIINEGFYYFYATWRYSLVTLYTVKTIMLWALWTVYMYRHCHRLGTWKGNPIYN